jgi:hypothetical protein
VQLKNKNYFDRTETVSCEESKKIMTDIEDEDELLNFVMALSQESTATGIL